MKGLQPWENGRKYDFPTGKRVGKTTYRPAYTPRAGKMGARVGGLNLGKSAGSWEKEGGKGKKEKAGGRGKEEKGKARAGAPSILKTVFH